MLPIATLVILLIISSHLSGSHNTLVESWRGDKRDHMASQGNEIKSHSLTVYAALSWSFGFKNVQQHQKLLRPLHFFSYFTTSFKEVMFSFFFLSVSLLPGLLKTMWGKEEPITFWSGSAHLDLGILTNFPQESLSSSHRMDGKCLWIAIFHRCFLRFKCRLWLGHSRTDRDLSWSHFSVVMAVCFGSTSHRNIHSQQVFESRGSRFSSKMSFIHPSLNSGQFPCPCCWEASLQHDAASPRGWY